MKYAPFALIASATSALAHPGHDVALIGTAHWLLSPMHGVGLVIAAAALWGLRAIRNKA